MPDSRLSRVPNHASTAYGGRIRSAVQQPSTSPSRFPTLQSRHIPPSPAQGRQPAPASSASSSISLGDAVNTLASQFKELASDVHLAELLRAVRRGSSGAEVQQWISRCDLAALNSRCAPHGSTGLFALCAPPLWLACYRSDHAVVQEMLRSGRCDANAVACGCSGKGRAGDCSLGGQSALHVAVSRGGSDAVRRLLGAGVDACAPCCFPVSEADEPEWDESSSEWGEASGAHTRRPAPPCTLYPVPCTMYPTVPCTLHHVPCA